MLLIGGLRLRPPNARLASGLHTYLLQGGGISFPSSLGIRDLTSNWVRSISWQSWLFCSFLDPISTQVSTYFCTVHRPSFFIGYHHLQCWQKAWPKILAIPKAWKKLFWELPAVFTSRNVLAFGVHSAIFVCIWHFRLRLQLLPDVEMQTQKKMPINLIGNKSFFFTWQTHIAQKNFQQKVGTYTYKAQNGFRNCRLVNYKLSRTGRVIM